jgi:Transposase
MYGEDRARAPRPEGQPEPALAPRIFAGAGWAEAHHDVCVMSQDGRVLGQRRVAHSVAGISELHALIAAHAGDGEPVVAGIEVDRGRVVTALLAAGCWPLVIRCMR